MSITKEEVECLLNVINGTADSIDTECVKKWAQRAEEYIAAENLELLKSAYFCR